MKRLLYIACLFLATLVLPATAEIIGVEQFDYPDGPIATKNGGTFWDYKNFTPTGHSGAASDWNDFTGAPVVTTGRLVTNGSSAKREYNGTLESDGAVNDPASVPSSISKSVYYRVTLTTGSTVPGFFGISSYDFTSEKLYFGKRSGQSKFGIEELGVSATDSINTPDILPNKTYTLVVRIDYVANLVRLFVDPDINASEESQLNAASRAYTGTNWSTAVRLASGGGGSAVTWDDLVVATTWEDLGTVVTTDVDEDNGNLNGSVSLREAVKYSPTGSLVTFAPALSGETLGLTHPSGTLLTQQALTIDATALSGGITLDGRNAQRIMTITATGAVTLRGLTFTGGNGVSSNSSGNAGALFADINTRTLVSRCTFSGNNSSNGNGGAIINLGIMAVSDSTFYGNRSVFQGGAIQNEKNLTVTGCTITANTAGSYGGGIQSQDVITLRHCTIHGNAGSVSNFAWGGGLDLLGVTATLENCIIWGNTSRGAPQDISAENTTLNRVGANIVGLIDKFDSVTENGPDPLTADPKLSPLGYFGGTVQTMHPLIGSPAIDAAGTTNPGGTDQRGFPRFVDGDDSTVAQLDIGAVEAGPVYQFSSATDGGLRSLINFAGQPSQPNGIRIRFNIPPGSNITLGGTELTPAAGKMIFLDASDLSAPVTISGDNASRVFSIPATATVAMHSLKIVKGNSGSGDGGGVNNSGHLTIAQSSISNNRGRIGGGLYNSGSGVLTLNQSTISANAAASSHNGGGIHNRGILRVNLSTIHGNTAYDGGGIDNDFGGSWTVEQSTISGNSASNYGGGLNTFGDTNFLRNSIVAANTAPNDPNIFGSFSSLGTNLTSGSLLLAPLGDYGGPTFTMLPLPGSPAINAATGSARTTDQRGQPINGIADIGAVEVQAALVGFTDTDSDGIDDRLEPYYGFVVGINDGGLDADGDGSINKDELGNKTGPRDASSLLKILSFARVGQNVTFTWTSFPGLSYNVEYGSDLNFGGTIGLGTATSMTTTQTIGPITGPKSFIRIRRN